MSDDEIEKTTGGYDCKILKKEPAKDVPFHDEMPQRQQGEPHHAARYNYGKLTGPLTNEKEDVPPPEEQRSASSGSTDPWSSWVNPGTTTSLPTTPPVQVYEYEYDHQRGRQGCAPEQQQQPKAETERPPVHYLPGTTSWVYQPQVPNLPDDDPDHDMDYDPSNWPPSGPPAATPVGPPPVPDHTLREARELERLRSAKTETPSPWNNQPAGKAPPAGFPQPPWATSTSGATSSPARHQGPKAAPPTIPEERFYEPQPPPRPPEEPWYFLMLDPPTTNTNMLHHGRTLHARTVPSDACLNRHGNACRTWERSQGCAKHPQCDYYHDLRIDNHCHRFARGKHCRADCRLQIPPQHTARPRVHEPGRRLHHGGQPRIQSGLQRSTTTGHTLVPPEEHQDTCSLATTTYHAFPHQGEDTNGGSLP